MNTIGEDRTELVASPEQAIGAAMTATAIVDRSFLGRIRVSGADRLDLLHRLSTNDLLSLKPYSSTGTIFITDKGRIVDYVRVIVQPDDLILITSSGYEEKVKAWIDKYTIMEDIQVSIISDDLQMLSLLGPDASSIAKEIFPQVPSHNSNCMTHALGMSVALDYQYEFSMCCFNIFLPRVIWSEKQHDFFEIIGEKCAQLSTAEYDCLRIMHGIPGGRTELVETFNPFDVGLHHSISFTKGCYIGQEVIARLDTYQKVQRGLVLFLLDEAISFSNEQFPILKGFEEIGILTSVATTRYKSGYPALGVVKSGKVNVGDVVGIKAQPVETSGVVQTFFEKNPS